MTQPNGLDVNFGRMFFFTPPDYMALGKQEAQAQFANEVAKNGYTFNPDALQEVIKELNDALDELRNGVTVQRFVEAPGADLISTRYAEAATQSVMAFNDAHEARVRYLQSYIDTLASIRDAYLRQDHAALEALRGATGKD